MKTLLMMASGKKGWKKIMSTEPNSLVDIWPIWESSGTAIAGVRNGHNGTASNLTLGYPGAGGKTCGLFTGTSYINIFSVGLAAALNSLEGTIHAECKIDAATWIDNTDRYIVRILADGNNEIFMRKLSGAGGVRGAWKGGNVTAGVSDATFSSSSFFSVDITFSKSANEMKFYANASQLGTTQPMSGTWAGAFTAALIGCSAVGSPPTAPFVGAIGNLAIWTKALSQAQLARLVPPL